MVSNKIDPAWLDRQIHDYALVRDQYGTLACLLGAVLKKACRMYAPEAVVQSRAKDISSFAEKVVRKGWKHAAPVSQFTDLAGVRVITHSLMEMNSICEFIQATFDIDEANSVDKRTTFRASEFGYLSMHFVVRIPDSAGKSILGVELPEAPFLFRCKAEIQVRTFLQHAWAGIAHDSIYKNIFQPPMPWLREMNRLAATLEEMDQGFDRFMARLHAYASSRNVYLTPEDREAEIETLKLILENEPDPDRKSLHALRIAEIHKTVENWQAMVETLMPFLHEGGSLMLREAGYALCRANKRHPGSPEYLHGLSLLQNAVDQAPADAEAHARLAWALLAGRLPQDSLSTQLCEEAILHLAEAYRLKPTNPYYLNAYLEHEILVNKALSHATLLNPILQQAIDACRAHAEVKIEIPAAWFAMGRFYLYANQPHDSLMAYLEGVKLCLREHEERSRYEMLQDELDFIEKLKPFATQLPGHDSVLRLLIISVFIKSGCSISPCTKNRSAYPDDGPCPPSQGAEAHEQQKALNDLLGMASSEVHYSGPVLILAGSSSEVEEYCVQGYRDVLVEAFQGFHGTIISGGTNSGVGKLAGDAAELSCSTPGGVIRAVAYLPKHTVQDTLDHRYTHIATMGRDFSPLEPLQAWIDLLASGIFPCQVKLLGIGGGAISAVEYRLALLLGSQVGIIAGSGREAETILGDAEWRTAGQPLPLLKDRMTIMAFVNTPNVTAVRDAIDAMARISHERYLHKKLQEPPREVHLHPWETLYPELQESNREQCRYAAEILRQAGFLVVEAARDETTCADPGFTPEEIEIMAEMEHGRWNHERLRAGWRYGGEKDVQAKISPYLRPWEELDDEIKDYDRDRIRGLPELFATAGLKIVRMI